MKKILLTLTTFAALAIGCTTHDEFYTGNNIKTLTVSLPEQSRTTLGDKNNDTYPLYWSESDKLCINGSTSTRIAISPNNPASATFEFGNNLNYPLAITYGLDAASDKVTFLAEQSYTEESFTQWSTPMAGYVENIGAKIELHHLSGLLRFAVKSENDNVTLDKIVITSSNAKLAGEFDVNCKELSITPTANTSQTVTYTANTLLSQSSEKIFYIALPAVQAEVCTVEFIDSNGKKMNATWKANSIKAGVVREFKTITYRVGTTCNLENFGSENSDFTIPGYISGTVKDTTGNPIEGVVISDGINCAATDSEGYYQFPSKIANAKFVFASIPSGYKALNDKNGQPQFYHRITEQEQKYQSCGTNFVFEHISSNPNRYTLLIGADPQTRIRDTSYDKFAYHSLDMQENLCQDMRETKATITDREVYGLMLGDIVHEDMALFTTYITETSKLGFQMFNIIGNHDHDLTASNDKEGSRCYEEHLGPSYYSFNIGKQHYVILDNIVMKIDSETGLLNKQYDYDLTAEQWEWLQNDLSFVDKSTTLMVAMHAPMFETDTGGIVYRNTYYGYDFVKLIASYKKVHAWAGHTHRTFNYPENLDHKNIESHTLARSTGPLWTNEYINAGTPRGYTIVDIDGDDIEWRFKATAYQAGYEDSNILKKYGVMPEYNYRDWDYENCVAIMKDTGKKLDDTYQMKVYKPNDYQNNYLYVNIFLWDEKWEYPKFNGVEMEKVPSRSAYCLGSNTTHNFYKEWSKATLANSSSYAWVYTPDRPDASVQANYIHTMFRIKQDWPETGSGTVTVKDRFGNTYSSNVSW